MAIPCFNTYNTNPPPPLPTCVANCTRWSQINNGEPVRYYNNDSHWAGFRAFYPNLTEVDLNKYVEVAIGWWEAQSYTGPGSMFVRTLDPQESQMDFVWEGNDGFGTANADCICDDDNTHPCFVKADHSVFFPGRAQGGNCRIQFNQQPGLGPFLDDDGCRHVLAHEIGHHLGLAHEFYDDVQFPEYDSIMDYTDQQYQGVKVHDIEEIAIRYPQNCEFEDGRDVMIPYSTGQNFRIVRSTETCPVCANSFKRPA